MNWPTWLGGAAFGNGIGILGIVITLVLFFLQVRSQIDAARERLAYANSELISLAIKRLALDDKCLKSKDFESFRQARAHQSGLSQSALINFELTLSCALKELMTNPFLDLDKREQILERVNSSRSTQTTTAIEKKESFQLASLSGISMAAATSLSLGVLVSSSLVGIISPAKPSGPETIMVYVSAAALLAGILVALIVAWMTLRRDQQSFKPTIDMSFLREIEHNTVGRQF